MVSTKNDQPKDSETHKPKKRDDIEKIIEKFEKHLDEKDMNEETYSKFVYEFSECDINELDYYIFQYSNQRDGNELTPILFLTITTAIAAVLKTVSTLDIPSSLFLFFVFCIIIWSMMEIKKNNKKALIRSQMVYVLKQASKLNDENKDKNKDKDK